MITGNNAFRDISIKRKLTFIIMLTSTIVVLMACAAFVANDMISFRRSIKQEVAILARVIGTNCTAALLFNDHVSAMETLSALSAQPHVVFACIYGKNGQETARYMRPGVNKAMAAPPVEGDGIRFGGDYLHLFRRILFEGEMVGTVYLQYDLHEIRDRLRQYAGIVCAILLAASGLAYLLSSRLQRVISMPLLRLADVVRAVSRDKDYSIRAEKCGRDEIGDLIDGFNEMLGQVKDRDTRLELHREQLEEQVTIRTAELRSANRELIAEMAERERTEKALASEKERLAVTLRSIGDGVIVSDLDGRIVLASKVAEELTGWTQEQALGLYLHQVFRLSDPASGGYRINLVEEALASGEISHNDAEHFTARDGRERIMTHTCAPIRDQDDDFIGVILVFRDITERQRVEEELLKSRKLESIGVLAGGIAHDFNNLLTAVLGNISLAKMLTTPEDKIRKRLTEAENASLRARDLTRQLLTFSKGGAPIRKTAFISEMLKESASFTLAGSNVKCNFLLSEDLWPVEVDEGQISQVINNLILNACQAMPTGGVVTLRAANSVVNAENAAPLKAGRYIEIAVEDHGEGIPQEHLPRIFDPYFTTKKMGNGLGLATCYSIVKKHDGLITVASRLGTGTTFQVFLPASREEGGRFEANPAEKAESGKGRVLLMDDEEMVREVAQALLDHIGYDGAFAQDGTEAVEMYLKARKSGAPFDVVIMDLTIPGGMGGVEAVRQLQALDVNVKAIVSSGYANDPIMADYKKWGFCGVIAKPYRIEELSRVLRDVIYLM